ncbi:MAG: MoxR family ATPase [Verrucomicrobiota bacterium]|nr:MoxR family ATPase [Verrucomicrobiota bacterium]MEC8656105.1 MoxR family ATPase [Verrucomicrobiota bacterium]MEC8789763.1 MoxR family ATPase [Verrucomicrobiota bacterium]MED5280232.1 MoxR family ATPase [Verrucomicrobiota bacterium]HAY75778.1 AAA family ATPase [Opitutae bacterium]
MSENNENDEKMARELVEAYERIKEQVHQVIVGQDAVLEQLLIAMLARGHCLLEGVPGLAKTLMIRSLAQAIDLGFRRIQFTPDLMPADITGTDIIQEDKQSGHRELIFEKGPIFSQIILADEINRTPPKTQAALLEAMQEHSVTIGGKTYDLDQPFFVLATQNPIEQEGTYPLPEAQRDRFIFQVLVEYPSREEERDIIKQTTSTFESKLKPVIDGPTLLRCQETVRKVPVPDHVYDFILDLVRMARPKEDQAADWVKDLIDWGPGPRACQQLVLGAKVRALLNGRFAAKVEDVKALAHPVLRHRIVPTFNAEAEGITVDSIIDRCIEAVPESKEAVL